MVATITEIRVIGLIDTTEDGPTALVGEDQEEQPVFLNQGTIDGACGPYCVFMTLLMSGLVRYQDVVSFDETKRSTSVQKLFGRMSQNYSALFREGTDLPGLKELLKGLFGKRMGISSCSQRGAKCRAFVEDQVSRGRPVVLGLDWSRGGHWVVVVGLEYFASVSDDDRLLCRFLVLDPSSDAPSVCSWNGIIDARGSGGPYPYTWWGEDTKVQFDTALAIWPKGSARKRG